MFLNKFQTLPLFSSADKQVAHANKSTLKDLTDVAWCCCLFTCIMMYILVKRIIELQKNWLSRPVVNVIGKKTK